MDTDELHTEDSWLADPERTVRVADAAPCGGGCLDAADRLSDGPGDSSSSPDTGAEPGSFDGWRRVRGRSVVLSAAEESVRVRGAAAASTFEAGMPWSVAAFQAGSRMRTWTGKLSVAAAFAGRLTVLFRFCGGKHRLQWGRWRL
jgi:hypothetical protein